MAGVAGELTIALRNTTAVDGTTIPLSGQFIAKGDDQVGRNVAVGVILGGHPKPANDGHLKTGQRRG
jgi:hypothetical protein